MRKIITLILILVLIVPVFNVHASVADDKTYEKLFFLNYLNITEGIEKEMSDYVTRAEFTAMVVRTVKLDNLNFEQNGFTDVSKESPFAKEIYTAKALRISNGTSGTLFSPDDAISYDAACKELVIALGYEQRAEYLGSYPSGYFRVASELGFAKGISSGGNLTFSDAVYMIYNALHTPVMVQSGVKGDGIIYSTSGKPLSVCFKLESVSGVVSTVDFMSDTDLYCAHNTIEISGRTFKCNLDAERFFGKSVTLWYDDKENIIAIDADQINKEVTLDMDEIVSVSGNEIKAFSNNGKEVKYKLDPGFGFIKNGKLINHTDSDFIANAGEVKLIDNNSDNLYDYYILEAKEYFVVRSINYVDKTIYDNNSPIKSINLDEDSEKSVKILKYNAQSNSYEKAIFDDIKPDSAVEVIQSEDKSVCKVIISDSFELSGSISEMGDGKIIVNDKEYEFNNYFNQRGRTISLGTSYDFILAPDTTITDIKAFRETDTHYGFTLGFGRGSGLSALVQIKLLTEDNTHEIYNFAENVKIDGVNKKREDPVFETKLKNGQYPVYELIRYSLNEKGEICMIDTPDTAQLSDNLAFSDNVNDSLSLYSEKSLLRYRWSGSYAMPNYVLNNTMIFTVPKDLENSAGENSFYDDECFRRGSITAVPNDTERKTNVYDLNSNYYPGAIVIFTNEASSSDLVSPGKSALSMMVLNITNATDAEGENVKKIYGVSGGKYREYYLYPSLETQLINVGKMPSKGDIVRLSLNGSKITGLASDVKCTPSGCDINYGIDSLGSYMTDELLYISGTLIAKDSASVVLSADKKPTPTTGAYINNIAPISLSAPSYTIYDMKSGEVYPAKEDSLQISGERQQYIVCRLDNYMASSIFIYLK